jgi:hypothetical protein
VEYFVVGAGAPVNPSRAHAGAVPNGSLKFVWARNEQQRLACQADPDCQFDAEVKDGSFAHVTLKDADRLKVDLITHHGEVVYTVNKPNPRLNQRATTVDRTALDAPQMIYTPYKPGSKAPQRPNSGPDAAASTDLLPLFAGIVAITLLIAMGVFKRMQTRKRASTPEDVSNSHYTSNPSANAVL